MFGWLSRLFAAPTCPGCGREIIEWTDESISKGYRVERRWSGCPIFRDTPSITLQGVRERDRHAAYWSTGKRTPLNDEP
jgi:hypothetical protein